MQWLRDQLGIIEVAAEVEALANRAGGSDGVVFVPALAGLGAPFWNPEVRGSLLGLTRGSSASNLAFATLEAIAFQVKAVVDAMALDAGRSVAELRVDGGAAANSLLLQIQADALGAQVVRAQNLESTGFGAALLAGLGAGVWSSLEDLANLNPAAQIFVPSSDRSSAYARWLRAVNVAADFANG